MNMIIELFHIKDWRFLINVGGIPRENIFYVDQRIKSNFRQSFSSRSGKHEGYEENRVRQVKRTVNKFVLYYFI